MKISELSQRSGVPIPTIKFYIREGLLPAGERKAQNQASYSDTHLALLELVRTLKDELFMSVPEIARIMAAGSLRGADFLEVGLSEIAKSRAGHRELDRDRPEFRKALSFAEQLFARQGWQPPGNDPASEDTVAALMTLLRVWPEMADMDIVQRYAALCQELAKDEIPDDWNPDADPIGTFKYALLGTYLFEPLLLSLRRVAHGERALALSAAREAQTTKKKVARRPAKKKRA